MHPHALTRTDPTRPATGAGAAALHQTARLPRPARDAALLAVALQLTVLYVPRAPGVATTGLPLDKLVHVAVFALPTAALIRTDIPRRWVIALMAAHAPLSEHIQGRHLAGRSAELADILADLAGVLLGTLASRPRARTKHPVLRGPAG